MFQQTRIRLLTAIGLQGVVAAALGGCSSPSAPTNAPVGVATDGTSAAQTAATQAPAPQLQPTATARVAAPAPSASASVAPAASAVASAQVALTPCPKPPPPPAPPPGPPGPGRPSHLPSCPN